jgi:hypothetical protein
MIFKLFIFFNSLIEKESKDTLTFKENLNINDLCAVCEAYRPTPEKILYINIC